MNLLWNESAGHFWGVSMNLAVSPSTPPSRQEHRSPRPKRQKISHEDGDYHPGTPPSKSEKTSPSSTINFTSDHRKVPPKSESDLTVPQDEHLQPSQTDLESALPDVRTDKEAIRDYEASRAAASSPPTDRADRISSRRWDPGKSSIYVDAFNLALDTVLNEEKHLFNLNELAVFDYWWNLNYEAQYLYVRLFLRKTAAWHRISKLGYYGDIADMPSAVATLWDIRSLPEDETPTLVFAGDLDPPLDDVLESKMWFAEDSTTHITTLEAASALLTLDELKEIAKDVKARGKNKGELLTAFRRTSKSQSGLHGLALDRNDSGDIEASGAVTPLESEELSNRPSGPIISLESASRAVNRDQLFLEKIKKRIGPCIRLSAPILKLFERVHLVFYRSTEWTEKSLTTLILARILKRNFPEYIVSRSADIFPSRESLLEFEASMRIQFAVDNLLEFSGVPNKVAFPRVLEIFEQVLPRWRVIVREEQLKEERVYETGEGAYLRRFSPAWVYTRIVHKGTYVLGRQHEHAREHAILTELLAQRLFHFSRRGAWYQRKALLEEHYMADLQPTCGRGAEAQKRYYRNLALDTCDAALQDPDCHVIYHYDLQKRIGKLERQLCIAKRFQHDFGHVTLTKPTERTFEGVQIRRRPSSRSRSRSRSVGGRRRSGSGAGTGAQVALSRSNSHSGPPPADTKPPPSTSRSPSGPGPTATGSGGGNGNGGKTVWLDPLEHAPCSVEAMCLSRYRQLGYRGFHAEGSLLRTLFAYLLYDVLFAYAPNVFQTACQTCPLDLHTDAFYPTRAGELEKRFAEIANGEGRGILRRVWEEHGGRRTCVVGLSWEFELQDLLEIVGCFRGEQLAGICKVMAQEYRERGGGVPDLFLWRLHGDGDGEEKETGDEGGGTMGEILFAEVKSENDRLSDTQRLWIHVLSSNGIAVELCNAVASEVVDEEEVAGRIKALRIG